MESEISDAIKSLKQELSHLRKALEMIGQQLEDNPELVTEDAQQLDDTLETMEQVEVGVVNNGVFRGKFQWANSEAIGITVQSESNDEVIVFKHAITYIRRIGKDSKERRGMYV